VKIGIYGSGGVGGYFGARLAAAGEDVAFIARGEHLRALREHGLRITGSSGELVVAPVRATDAPEEIGPCDAVIVAVKGFQLQGIVPSLRALVGPTTVVVPLLNGVEAPYVLAEALGHAVVAGGTCRIVSRVAAPGVIEHVAATPEVLVGALGGGAHAGLSGLVDALVRAGVQARQVDDIERAMWEKLVFIAAYGGVGSLLGGSIGAVRSDPVSRALLEQALREGEAVARARGVAVGEDLVARSLAYLDALAPEAKTSMQRDLEAGRASELEDWNGAIVRAAVRVGVEVPVHCRIVEALRGLDPTPVPHESPP
jgi:2-dehydropantoate 2-reductase